MHDLSRPEMELIEYIAAHEPVTASHIGHEFPNAVESVPRLLDAGAIRMDDRYRYQIP